MTDYNVIINADCLTGIKTLDDNSIDCCVTSPPYWGLRDYGCDGQIGLEETPDKYVAKMVEVFQEVRRVLKKDGTFWLNLGDSYATGTTASRQQSINPGVGANCMNAQNSVARVGTPPGCKTKDLVGIPWMVAFALRSDGWYLRQDIIWHKPNPMPESVTDRCTKAHEYIFLMSKSAKYYFDADAISEPFADDRLGNPGSYKRTTSKAKGACNDRQDLGFLNGGNGWNENGARETRNKRDVWSVSTKPFTEAHFATFPEDLIEPCVLAGCPVGGIVLDPFMGSGTTACVAVKNGRKYIGTEINPKYVEMANKRIEKVAAEKAFTDSQIALFEAPALDDWEQMALDGDA